MKLVFIAAIGKNRVIGKDGRIPWHISEDLRRFKRLTTGHAVLMGRKTFESLGKPLSNRRNVVISSRPLAGIETYSSIDDALLALADQEKVFVIGGGTVYAQLLGRADELLLTFVDQDIEGETKFPEYERILKNEFREMFREEHVGFTFVDYVRIKPHKA